MDGPPTAFLGYLGPFLSVLKSREEVIRNRALGIGGESAAGDRTIAGGDRPILSARFLINPARLFKMLKNGPKSPREAVGGRSKRSISIITVLYVSLKH